VNAGSDRPEQLSVLVELDAAEGLDPWIDSLPCPPWPLTAADLARRAGCHVETMKKILVDEEKRGHVVRDGNGWRATDGFQAQFGRGFKDMTLGSSLEDKAA
jgi:hypothetical protein